MRIKIAIQDSCVREEYADRLIDACRYLGIPHEYFGLVPFSDKITGNILLDKESIIIPFGATKLIDLYNQGKLPQNWKIFHDNEGFSQSTIAGELWLYKKLLLNGDASYYAFPQCKDLIFDADKFVKPDTDSKLFNAEVLPAGKSLEMLLAERTTDSSVYNKNEKVLFAPVKDIIDEFRIFVVADEVVTKSIYRHNGKLTGGLSYKFSWLERFIINNLATIYKPAFAYVVDICTTKGRFGKNWHILEYNALQCSGFYNCDAKQILHAIVYYGCNTKTLEYEF